MGSPAIAGWIAHAAFWSLLVWGWARGDLGRKGIGLFLLVWLAALYGFPYLPYGRAMFSSFVAVMDIALVLLIFKADVRLT